MPVTVLSSGFHPVPETCHWARRALKSSDINLPDTTLSAFTNTPILQLFSLFPQIKAVAGDDLSDLSPADFAQFTEAAGWLTAARWMLMPRTEDEQIVVSAKIAELAVVYKVTLPSEFAMFFESEGYKALYQMSMISPLLFQQNLALSGIAVSHPDHHFEYRAGFCSPFTNSGFCLDNGFGGFPYGSGFGFTTPRY